MSFWGVLGYPTLDCDNGTDSAFCCFWRVGFLPRDDGADHHDQGGLPVLLSWL